VSAAAEYWPPRIRAMTESDLDAVWEIERRAYEFPWSRGIFLDCLRVPYVCHVYEEQGRVIGYAVMSLAADEAHLLNLCLAEAVRGRGLGRRMLKHLTLQAMGEGARVLFLEVRPTNADALRLYQDAGFRRVGVRRDYYQAAGGREDALVLALNL
jgi:[ribosomal protein S18]-alanine N-acetyltransferase